MGKGGSVSDREGIAMSQDALVNTGAVAWPGLFSAEKTVARMQAKLHLWAARDPGRRFGDLFNLVYDPAFLRLAWERVATNKGAGTPGIDKATAGQIETWAGVEAFLGQIRDSLKSGEFGPVEVRRVLIPKKSGKLRKLGIPTIADRVVQASLKLVLEPIFEADFKPCSYGFRPNRRAQDAIAEIHHFASEPSNYRWVLEADIKSLFRRNRSYGFGEPAAGTGQGQASVRAGEGVPESRGLHGTRRPGRDIHRHPARRNSIPAAGEHRTVGARRPFRPEMAAAYVDKPSAGQAQAKRQREFQDHSLRRRLCATNATGGCDVGDCADGR